MKKLNILLTLIIALVVTSCRQDADYVENPSNLLVNQSNATFVNQFKTIWNVVNTGYNFWDITADTVNWDARYKKYLPMFKELDEDYSEERKTVKETGGDMVVLNKKYQTILTNYYTSLTAGLQDFHMAVMVRNPYEEYCDNMAEKGISVIVSIPKTRILARTECHLDADGHKMADGNTSAFFNNMSEVLNNYPTLVDIKTAETDDKESTFSIPAKFIYALIKLSDGRVVPYFWLSNFAGISKVLECYELLEDEKAKAFMDAYFGGFVKQITSLTKEEMAGAIIDVRENSGGAVADMPFYVGEFLGKDEAFWEARYKEGMGRYDMSAYVNDSCAVVDGKTLKQYKTKYPNTMEYIANTYKLTTLHRDFAAENIPVVCLADMYSISCAEISSGSIQCMPTGYVIGERTYGGEGELILSEMAYNQNFCGVVGSPDLKDFNFYVYTSNFEHKMRGQPCYEGIGISPNQEVLYNEQGFKGQFDAAIEYLQSKQ